MGVECWSSFFRGARLPLVFSASGSRLRLTVIPRITHREHRGPLSFGFLVGSAWNCSVSKCLGEPSRHHCRSCIRRCSRCRRSRRCRGSGSPPACWRDTGSWSCSPERPASSCSPWRDRVRRRCDRSWPALRRGNPLGCVRSWLSFLAELFELSECILQALNLHGKGLFVLCCVLCQGEDRRK